MNQWVKVTLETDEGAVTARKCRFLPEEGDRRSPYGMAIANAIQDHVGLHALHLIVSDIIDACSVNDGFAQALAEAQSGHGKKARAERT